MTEHEYDVVVLGGGTAGTAAARAASRSGARTVMFNDGELGGLCILRGCMPTKTMLHAAHLLHHAQHPGPTGVRPTKPDVDFAALMANKDDKVERFKQAKVDGIAAGDYEVIDARAHFVAPDAVAAGDARYRFSKGAVIATGSEHQPIPLPGVEDVDFWTSDEVMRQADVPRSLIVIGSGPIGLELAQFFARVGAEVSLVSRRRLLTDVDPLMSDELERAIDDEPRLRRYAPATPVAVRTTRAGVELDVTSQPGAEQETYTLRAERLLLATGRRAALDGLGLDAAGVETKRNRVLCGDDMRTSNPRVFVAGDATGALQILHVANWEGEVAGRGAAQVPGEHAVERRLAMSVIFTDPPLATLGLSEAQARETGRSVITASATTFQAP